MIVLNLLMRWLHIFSVITAVGATVFLRLALIPALSGLTPEAADSVFKGLARKLRLLIHGAIGGIIVSGLYNTHVVWKSTVSPYGAVFAGKMLLALTVFVIAILLTSSNPKRAAFQANRKTWLMVNVLLAATIVALSSILRMLHE